MDALGGFWDALETLLGDLCSILGPFWFDFLVDLGMILNCFKAILLIFADWVLLDF